MPGDSTWVSDAQLRRIVSFAYEQVPYYRTILDRRGISSTRIQTRETFSSCPRSPQAISDRSSTH